MIASFPRFGNSTTPDSLPPLKCSANVSASGLLASPGLSSSTNSNGRLAVAVVIGGVSHRNAENGESAKIPRNIERKSASSCQRRKTSAYETGDESRSMETRIMRPLASCSLRGVHIRPLPQNDQVHLL